MAATVCIYVDKYHPKADGKCAVSIRVTFNRKKRYYPTDYKLTPEHWDDIHKPDARKKDREILKDLVALESKATDIIKELKDHFSFTLFEKRYSKPVDDNLNIFSQMEERAVELRKEGRVGTAVSFECAVKSLKKFHTKEVLTFDQANGAYFNSYKSWMLKEGNSKTTIGMYLRNVRTIFNAGIKTNAIPKEIYPFGDGKDQCIIPTSKNHKKALTKEEVSQIYHYAPETESERRARDFWLLSYMANGMNIKDIALLRNSNIKGGMIVFERAKTQRSNEGRPVIISVVITSQVQAIIDRWGNKTGKPKDFIFPILQEGIDPETEYKSIQLFTAFVNKNMRKITRKLKIEANCTTYVARHSFSTILRRSGASDEFISEALGHSSLQTTRSYLGSFEDEQKRQLANALVDFS